MCWLGFGGMGRTFGGIGLPRMKPIVYIIVEEKLLTFSHSFQFEKKKQNFSENTNSKHTQTHRERNTVPESVFIYSMHISS